VGGAPTTPTHHALVTKDIKARVSDQPLCGRLPRCEEHITLGMPGKRGRGERLRGGLSPHPRPVGVLPSVLVYWQTKTDAGASSLVRRQLYVNCASVALAVTIVCCHKRRAGARKDRPSPHSPTRRHQPGPLIIVS